jgi:hypothetical protein
MHLIIQTSRAGQAGWRKSREGRTYKEKGEPIGTMPDRLAGTAVNSVISWKTLSLTILDPCLMLPLSLDPVCACHLWIWPLSCWQLWSPSPHFSILFTFFTLHFRISSLPFLLTSLFFPVLTDFTSLLSSLPCNLMDQMLCKTDFL